MQWNVFRENINRQTIEVFDVFNHTSFYNDVVKLKKKKLNREDFSKKLRSISMYYFWCKCEHEVVITSWPPYIDKKEMDRLNRGGEFYRKNVNLLVGEKIDIYQQLALNWERFVDYVFCEKIGGRTAA